MKKRKILASVFAATAAIFGLASCGENTPTSVPSTPSTEESTGTTQSTQATSTSTDTESREEKIVKAALAAIKLDESVSADFELPTSGAGNVEIIWSSSMPNVIVVEGGLATVSRQTSDVKVVLTAAAILDDVRLTKDFEVTVEKITIQETGITQITPTDFLSYSFIDYSKVVPHETRDDEFTIKSKGSISSSNYKGITSIVAEIYGTYDNMVMYGGSTDNTGNKVTATVEELTSKSGKKYIYTFETPVDAFYYVNESNYTVNPYSITINYASIDTKLDADAQYTGIDSLIKRTVSLEKIYYEKASFDLNMLYYYYDLTTVSWGLKEGSTGATVENGVLTIEPTNELQKFTLVANVSVEGKDAKTIEFDEVVVSTNPTPVSIEELVETEDGEFVVVEGTVVYKNTSEQITVLRNESGAGFYVYGKDFASSAEVGKSYLLYAELDIYNGLYEVKYPEVISSSEGIADVSPLDINSTVADYVVIDKVEQNKYVTLTGTYNTANKAITVGDVVINLFAKNITLPETIKNGDTIKVTGFTAVYKETSQIVVFELSQIEDLTESNDTEVEAPVVDETLITIDPSTFSNQPNLVLENVVENTSHPEEFTISKNGGSIKNKNLIGVKSIVIDVYGTYDNLKVYAGNDDTATLITATKSTGTGTVYTYTFETPVDAFYVVNPSNYNVQVYSVKIDYTSISEEPVTPPTEEQPGGEVETPVVDETLITIDPSNFSNQPYLVLDNVVENTKYPEEFTINKNGGSIKNKNLIGVKSIVIDVYGTYDNLKVYAGNDETGTLITATKSTGTGTLYTYTFETPVDAFYVVNPSNYAVQVFSVKIDYTSISEEPVTPPTEEQPGEEVETPVVEGTKVEVKYSGSSTTNMTAGENNAASVGLDATLYNVTTDKCETNNQVGLNKDGSIRLYHKSGSANGCKLTIESLTDTVIKAVIINIKSSENRLTVNGAEVSGAKITVEVNGKTLVLQNSNQTAQVQITSIELIVDDAQSEETTTTPVTE